MHPLEPALAAMDEIYLAEFSPTQPHHNPIAGPNEMVETGFDGRGVIKVKDPHKKPDLAYKLFIQQLGDDENYSNLKLALSQSDAPQAANFLRLLLSVKNKSTRIEVLAKRCGIGIPQLREIWRTARLDQGLLALLNEYPRAMRDVARDARSVRRACEFCAGTGRIVDEHAPQPKTLPKPMGKRQRQAEDATKATAVAVAVTISCHSCGGRGWVRKSGDKDARNLMGQILGVSGKAAPLINSNVTNINLESVINEIEQMTQNGQFGANGSRGLYDAQPGTVAESD